MKFSFLISGTTVGLIVSTPLLAHHSFRAMFDSNQPVEVTGTVTEVEWTNPHARFYVDVEDENGETVNWNFELASPNSLFRRGWSRNSLKPGDVVTVTAVRARNDPYVANTATITFADGRQLGQTLSSPPE